jgi:Zn-dependent alcohol dehydrogenase
MGQQSICDLGATILEGCLPDGSYVFTVDGQNAGAMCMLGTFAQHAVISETSAVKIDDDLPLEIAVLCGCGVPTGWGSAVNTGNTQIGDTVVVFGIGGIGANAVQGAAHAGATNIIAVDPLDRKREFAQEMGATHSSQNGAEAVELALELTRGVGADVAIVTVDVVGEQVVQEAAAAIRKGGVLVLTGLAHPEALTVHLSGLDLTIGRKQVRGSLFGDCNPTQDIKKMLSLYRSGKLKLDELVTKQYKLEDINQGYADLDSGQNIRGVIIHDG